MNNETSSHYLHGTQPDEQRRLSLLNDLLNAGSLREMRLQGAERVLDVGSGLGLIALLACWIPARRAAKVDPMIALRCE